MSKLGKGKEKQKQRMRARIEAEQAEQAQEAEQRKPSFKRPTPKSRVVTVEFLNYDKIEEIEVTLYLPKGRDAFDLFTKYKNVTLRLDPKKVDNGEYTREQIEQCDYDNGVYQMEFIEMFLEGDITADLFSDQNFLDELEQECMVYAVTTTREKADERIAFFREQRRKILQEQNERREAMEKVQEVMEQTKEVVNETQPGKSVS